MHIYGNYTGTAKTYFFRKKTENKFASKKIQALVNQINMNYLHGHGKVGIFLSIKNQGCHVLMLGFCPPKLASAF